MEKQKIPCVMLAYYNLNLIKTTVDFLLKCSDDLEIIVLENKSKNTENEIKPYLLNLVKNKKISMYAEFEENISNNAWEEFFDMNIIDLAKNEKIMVTDGDLSVDSNDWLDEEINIIDKHPEVFVCCIDLKSDNLPVKQIPEAINWISQPNISVTNDYVECPTGVQLLLMRTNDFMSYYKFMKNNKLTFKDSFILEYCYALGRKWVKTKRNKAEHLTWNIYADLNNPYTKYKLTTPHAQIWYHSRYCNFTLHTLNGKKTYKYNKIDKV